MDEHAALLSDIDTYIAARGIAETTFGRMAVNDGKFVARVRRGGNITFATAARVREFIRANPPGPHATRLDAPARPAKAA